MKHSSSPTIRDLPVEERPQERLERLGASALPDRELLAMLIRSGTARHDVLATAELIGSAGFTRRALRWDSRISESRELARSRPCNSAPKLRRCMMRCKNRRFHLDEPQKVGIPLPANMPDTVEKCLWVRLDRKNNRFEYSEISGTATGSLGASEGSLPIRNPPDATALILAHNHPSGRPFKPKWSGSSGNEKIEASKAWTWKHDHIILENLNIVQMELVSTAFSDAGLIG